MLGGEVKLVAGAHRRCSRRYEWVGQGVMEYTAEEGHRQATGSSELWQRGPGRPLVQVQVPEQVPIRVLALALVLASVR